MNISSYAPLVTPHLKEQGTNGRWEWWLVAFSGRTVTVQVEAVLGLFFLFPEMWIFLLVWQWAHWGQTSLPHREDLHFSSSSTRTWWSQSGSRGKTEWVGSLLCLEFFSSFLLKVDPVLSLPPDYYIHFSLV